MSTACVATTATARVPHGDGKHKRRRLTDEQHGQATQRRQGQVGPVRSAWADGRQQSARGEAGVWVGGIGDDQELWQGSGLLGLIMSRVQTH